MYDLCNEQGRTTIFSSSSKTKVEVPGENCSKFLIHFNNFFNIQITKKFKKMCPPFVILLKVSFENFSASVFFHREFGRFNYSVQN